MSNPVPSTPQSFTFVSKDGADREVAVQCGTGHIKTIEYSSSGTANIVITSNHSKIKHPINGWVQADSEILNEAKKAYDNNDIVLFRIEMQRKNKVDGSIPISELRKTMEDANKNTNKILASLNGIFSEEAVTNPDDDPSAGGRVSALNRPHQKNEESQGAYKNIPGSVSAEEGKPWMRTNPDGTLNIGSYSVLAVVRAEHIMRKELLAAGISPNSSAFQNLITGYVIASLSIMDKIQGYTTQKRPNRFSNSYTRAREIVLDTIENSYPLSMVEKDRTLSRSEWYRHVGKESMNRFLSICKIDAEGNQFNLDAFLGNAQQSSQGNTQSSPQKPQVESHEQNTTPASDNAPVSNSSPTNLPEENKPLTDEEVNQLRPPATEEESQAGLAALEKISKNNQPTSNTQKAEVFPRDNQKREGENPNPPTSEVVDLLKELMQDTEISTDDLAYLLEQTFNVNKVIEIDNDKLEEFVNHYIDYEIGTPGNLKEAINAMKNGTAW